MPAMGTRGIIAATLLLAACIPSKERRPEAPSAEAPRAESQDAATRQCHADLRRDDVEFKILPDRVVALDARVGLAADHEPGSA